MFKFNQIVFLGIIVVLCDYSQAKLSKEQFTISMNMMRDACMDQFKSVTLEKTENMRKKNFQDDDKDLKCYTNCVWEAFGPMKNGIFSADAMLEQIEMMVPKDWQEDIRKGTNGCKDAGKDSGNACETAYAVTKCFISNVPVFYMP